MAGIGAALAIVFGLIAAVLFVIAVAVFEGYLGVGGLYGGLTAQNLAVYGVLSTIGAIGGSAWETRSGRR